MTDWLEELDKLDLDTTPRKHISDMSVQDAKNVMRLSRKLMEHSRELIDAAKLVKAIVKSMEMGSKK